MSGPCPTCKGRDIIIDPLSGSEEAYSCPDCGGSGKSEALGIPAF